MEPLREARDTYRLIVTRRNASELLVATNGFAWALPRVEIHPQQRVAEQLTAECRKAWGVESYCLLVPDLPSCNGEKEPRCAVMESVPRNNRAPAGMSWIPSAALPNSSEEDEIRLIRESLAQLEAYASGEKPGPLAKPGWLQELSVWTQEQLSSSGGRLTGGFRQLNASPTFSLIRLETRDGTVWFKATGEPNAHELPLAVTLARLFPKYVPRVLAVHQGWNGWLSEEVAGMELDQFTDCTTWERTAEELARLQIASIGKTTELLEAQCKDLRIPRLIELVDPFLKRMAELMAVQQKSSPAPLDASELASLREGLVEACAVLRSLNIPDTLGHIDVNPGNILVSEGHCVFLDWAEGCVSNPVITFEYLRRHLERSGINEPAVDSRATAAYLRPWRSLVSEDILRRAVAAVPAVAVLAHAVAGDSWRTLDPASNPVLTAYFRSLTRRMYRDAVLAAERSEPCLN